MEYAKKKIYFAATANVEVCEITLACKIIGKKFAIGFSYRRKLLPSKTIKL